MSTPVEHTYHYDAAEILQARRPGLDDLGGAAKVDDQVYPPDPQEDLTADDVNQWQKLITGLCHVTTPLCVSVTFAAGVPSIAYFAAQDYQIDAPTLIGSGDLEVVDNGVGDTTIRISSELLPARFTNPRGLTMNDAAAAIDEMSAAPYSAAGWIGVRVVTLSPAGATDCNFTVEF